MALIWQKYYGYKIFEENMSTNLDKIKKCNKKTQEGAWERGGGIVI